MRPAAELLPRVIDARESAPHARTSLGLVLARVGAGLTGLAGLFKRLAFRETGRGGLLRRRSCRAPLASDTSRFDLWPYFR